MTVSQLPLLAGKRGLVTGIANESSIAAGCARAFAAAGAQLATTYFNDKARPFVEPVARLVDASILMPLNVETEGELEAIFSRIGQVWGRLDFLLHSIAYCPLEDLHGRVTDCSRQGFSRAMDISVHSFIRMARLAEPLMKEGGALLTVTYFGAERVVENYNVMGPVKAALQGAVRYLAAELGSKGIRVNALSPGPLKTRAASGIAHFDSLIDEARSRVPLHRLVALEDVGNMAVALVSDGARSVTGNIAYVDAGYHVTD
jgi:enoyl-[acyl-carrier protein] reductase I